MAHFQLIVWHANSFCQEVLLGIGKKLFGGKTKYFISNDNKRLNSKLNLILLCDEILIQYDHES